MSTFRSFFGRRNKKPENRYLPLFQELDDIIVGMKEMAKHQKESDQCSEAMFYTLLTYPAGFRKIPGIAHCLGLEPLEQFDEEDKPVAREFLKQLGFSNLRELQSVIGQRYSKQLEYEDFYDFWNGKPRFQVEELEELGREAFLGMKSFAEQFREVLDENGFLGFDICETMNLIRTAYACDVITKADFLQAMMYFGKKAFTTFEDWDSYMKSYVCGSAYFMYERTQETAEEAFHFFEMNLTILPNCPFYEYGWISKKKIMEILSVQKSKGEEDTVIRVEKKPSYMIAVEEIGKELLSLEAYANRLTQNKAFTVQGMQSVEENGLEVQLLIRENSYKITLRRIDFTIPDMFRLNHMFPDVEMEKLEHVTEGLDISMMFGENPLESLQVQIEIVHTLMPDAMVVLDDSSEKILSPKWIALQAECKTLPAPKYLYTVQAVVDEDGDAWLHTHGLNRCGIPEVEVIGSDRENYNKHYHILNLFAMRLLEGIELEEKEPLYIAKASEDISIVATMVAWPEALEKFDGLSVGGLKDRIEGHNKDTYPIFVYANQKAYEAGEYVPVNIYDDYMDGNPLLMISTEETERMSSLAKERVAYMKQLAQTEDTVVLVKVCLDVDEEFVEECSGHEHIYFECKELMENGFRGELTQEPYYMKSLHQGDFMEISFSQITDWIAFQKERSITPDDVYIMELD